MDGPLVQENFAESEAILNRAPAPAAGAAGLQEPQLLEYLQLLNNSQGLIRTIFLGLALQHRSLDMQKSQLLAQAQNEAWKGLEPKAVQTAASLITLCALFGFQRQAETLAAQEAMAGGCPDMTDVKLGAAVILIALIRIARLNRPAPSGQEELGSREMPEGLEESEELEELEELAEPAV